MGIVVFAVIKMDIYWDHNGPSIDSRMLQIGPFTVPYCKIFKGGACPQTPLAGQCASHTALVTSALL